jgi:hypothetical protein
MDCQHQVTRNKFGAFVAFILSSFEAHYYAGRI